MLLSLQCLLSVPWTCHNIQLSPKEVSANLAILSWLEPPSCSRGDYFAVSIPFLSPHPQSGEMSWERKREVCISHSISRSGNPTNEPHPDAVNLFLRYLMLSEEKTQLELLKSNYRESRHSTESTFLESNSFQLLHSLDLICGTRHFSTAYDLCISLLQLNLL